MSPATSIILLTQNFRSIPLNLRKNIENWIFSKPSNKREFESVWVLLEPGPFFL
ncbi:hypothetical protein T492DRAFT_1037927 [Pavlovales sp. CCMP2436]|nr:hypothetical protein T492DRAFT_1037927 [Pavlovales sp. CCMP2436]